MGNEKTLVVVGPEAIKNFFGGYSYARRLKEIQEKVSDKLNIVMLISCELSPDKDNNSRLKRLFMNTVQDYIDIQCMDEEELDELDCMLVRENDVVIARSTVEKLYSYL